MTDLRTAAQQALEALEADNSKLWPSDRRTAAYFNLRAALAEPVQEPAAWSHINGTSDTKWHPPQRKPLTEEEIDGLMQSIGLRCADDGNERMANHAEWERRQRRRIARAVERAHGI